jgi:hypothetical protein
VGNIVSLVALLLAFPLSLLANLATPKIRNWWAERSKTALENRIRKLEAELRKLEAELEFLNQCPPMSEAEKEILIASSRLGRMVVFAVYCVISSAVAAAIGYIYGLQSRIPHFPPEGLSVLRDVGGCPR